MRRFDLPARRAHDAFQVWCRGQTYTVGFATYHSGQLKGRLAEVFIDSAELASDMHDDARDIAVLISIAVQHGVPIDAMRSALTRLEDGSAAGLAATVLDALAEEVAA